MHIHILRCLCPTTDELNKISKNGVNLGHRQFLKAPPSDTNKQLGWEPLNWTLSKAFPDLKFWEYNSWEWSSHPCYGQTFSLLSRTQNISYQYDNNQHVFMKSLYFTNHFLNIIFFFFPHINSMRKSGWLLLTFYRWGNWGFKDQIHRYRASSTRSIGNNHAHILISNGSRQEQVPGIPATRVWIPLLSFISLISWGKFLNLCKYHV